METIRKCDVCGAILEEDDYAINLCKICQYNATMK